MQPGDVTSYTDHFGRQRVAIILERLPDGRFCIFCPQPSHLAVEASNKPDAPGNFSNRLAAHENPVHPALFSGDVIHPTAEGGVTVDEGAGVAFDGDGNLIDAPAAPVENRGDVTDEPAKPEQGE